MHEVQWVYTIYSRSWDLKKSNIDYSTNLKDYKSPILTDLNLEHGFEGLCLLWKSYTDSLEPWTRIWTTMFIMKVQYWLTWTVSDEAMTLLFGDGRGKVFLGMLEWLNSNDEYILSTAVLAMANFAHNGKNKNYHKMKNIFFRCCIKFSSLITTGHLFLRCLTNCCPLNVLQSSWILKTGLRLK